MSVIQNCEDTNKKEENIKLLLKKELGVDYALPKYNDIVGKKVHVLVGFGHAESCHSLIRRICSRSTPTVRSARVESRLVHIDEDYSVYVFDASEDSYFNFFERRHQEVGGNSTLFHRMTVSRRRRRRPVLREKISTAS